MINAHLALSPCFLWEDPPRQKTKLKGSIVFSLFFSMTQSELDTANVRGKRPNFSMCVLGSSPFALLHQLLPLACHH